MNLHFGAGWLAMLALVPLVGMVIAANALASGNTPSADGEAELPLRQASSGL